MSSPEQVKEFQAPKEILPPHHSSRPYIVDNASRSMSIDSRDDHVGHRDMGSIRGGHPPSPRSPHGMGSRHQQHPTNMAYPPRYSSGRGIPSRHVQSVVTSSFSIDEERDDTMHHVFRHGEPTIHSMDNEEAEREGWTPHGSHGMYTPATPSPKTNPMEGSPLIKRAFSSSGYFVPTDTMKRSYYHHSVPTSQYPPTQLPPDFMPPTKRTRVEPRRREIVIPSHEEHHQVPRPHSFPTPPPQPWTPPRGPMGHQPHGQYPRSPMGYHSGGGYQQSRSPRGGYHQISPASEHDDSPSGSWGAPSQPWSPTPRRHSNHFWESPRGRDPNEGFREPYPRQHSYSQEDSMMLSGGDDKMRMMNEPTQQHHRSTDMGKSGSIMLLALPQDRVSLSETLCVVRENIEVFTATQADVDAPAPGRKHAVVVGQVGLRCIHCRHTTKCSDRVKRAVCYPSSIKRIYRTVIDMKLDHFSQCKFVPVALKNRLDELKAVHSRSTGTTMQYFIHAAHCLGMEDSSNGVQLRESVLARSEPQAVTPRNDHRHHANHRDTGGTIVTRCDSMSSGSWMSGSAMDFASPPRIDTMSSGSFEATGNMTNDGQMPANGKWFQGCVPLALGEDTTALSPLRCFLREQVCAFSATENDIAVRAPTTFSISVGQVGIGCIHCIREASKLRSNRAVCFPFSIGRIYQSVADIQRFHFGECKMMPPEVKEKFLELQSASSKGSKGLATRQYWVTSAKKIGLVDTTQGIRFGRDPAKPEASGSFSLDILAQVAFSVTTASKQLVLPEDKPCIADFLYVVMEQLQPCRFTEADRNKRRLKDVGCIGVECKHCAGKVDSRKFFWSSVSAVESNFVSVHTHMLECKSVPQPLKDRLVELKKLRKEQTASLKSGSQKAFFARVWKRLHEDEDKGGKRQQAQVQAKTQTRLQDGPTPNAPTSTATNEGNVADTTREEPPLPKHEDNQGSEGQIPSGDPTAVVEATSNVVVSI